MKKLVAVTLALAIVLSLGTTAFAAENSDVAAYVQAPQFAGYYFKKDLVADEEAATEKILTAFENMQTRVDVSECNINVKDLSKLYFSAVYENPQYFYVETTCSFSYDFFTNTITSINIFYNDDLYITVDGQKQIDKRHIAEQRAELEAAYNKIIAMVPDTMSKIEIVLFLHEYLAGSIYYDYDNLINSTAPDSVYNAYGALVDKVAVCQGYSMAFILLCKEFDINVIYAASFENNHGWNMVEIDGNWYHLDITFDDPVYNLSGQRLYYSALRHSYFLVGDADINDTNHDNSTMAYSYSQATPDANKTLCGIWSGVEGAMLYCDGYWYYSVDHSIVKSKIDGSDRTVITENCGMNVNMTTDGEKIYYCNTKGIYSVNFDGSNKTTLYTAVNETIYGCYFENGYIRFEYINQNAKREEKGLLISDEAAFDKVTSEEEDEIVDDIISGDLNGDNKVTVGDILVLKNNIMQGIATERDDVNGDGKITVADILAIKALIAA